MLTVGRWSKLLLSSAEGWEWRFQSKTVKSWEKMHFIQAEIPALSGLHKTQKTYLLSPHKYRLERYPPQGPNLNRDEGCVKDIQERAAAVICSWSRSCDCHLPLSPTTTSLSFLIPASSKLRGPHIYGHTGLGLTQEKAPTFIRWLQVTKLDQHQRWGQWASQPFVPLWSILLIPAGFCCYISPGDRKAALGTSEMWRAKSPLGEQFPFAWAALSMSQQARLHTWGLGFGALQKRLPYRIPKAKIN